MESRLVELRAELRQDIGRTVPKADPAGVSDFIRWIIVWWVATAAIMLFLLM